MGTTVRAEPLRFYDGGAGEEPPRRDRPPRIVLERRLSGEQERFAMLRRVGYADRHLGELLVPADPARFTTDLTSVPTVFAWLVPRTGRHLPAALVHDALVAHTGEPAYVSRGGRVDRVEADRVFRDAMADTGTGVVRRWLAWSAVTLATIVVAPGAQLPWGPAVGWWRRGVAVGSLLLIGWLGWCASWDLMDRGAWLAVPVPWMPESTPGVELAHGAAGAVVVPLLLGLLWGRFRVAGAVLGVGLALLLHVTVLVAALTLLYRAVEAVATRVPLLAGAVLVGGVAASVVLVLDALV
jgi:hypothetical protein